MIAGVTGHQRLGPSTVIKWISDTFRNTIKNLKIHKGLTSLAIGADQLFAEILLEQHLPFIAVIPSLNYEDTFKEDIHLSNYKKLLLSSSNIVHLNFNEPTESSFLESGKYIVEHSDIIMAVWDGFPSKGLGGTGDIVNYAEGLNKPIIYINPKTLQIIMPQE